MIVLNMIVVFTWIITINFIDDKIIKNNVRKMFVSEREMYVKLVALCINRYRRNSSQFQTGW